MEQYIPKSALVAEINKLEIKNSKNSNDFNLGAATYLGILKHFVNTLEVKEVDEVSNPSFPHYKNIVDKVLGVGNLESWEYEEAKQLVSLAKEELLKDLEVKEVDLNWQDIYSILYIERLVMRDFGNREHSNEEICQEVLKRYKAQKGE